LRSYRALEEQRGFAPKTRGVSWDAVRFTFSYVPLGLMLCAAAREMRRWRAAEAKRAAAAARRAPKGVSSDSRDGSINRYVL